MIESIIFMLVIYVLLLACIAFFPFGYALHVYRSKGYNEFGQYQFAFLSTLVVYGFMVLVSILLIPLTVFIIKILPQFDSIDNSIGGLLKQVFATVQSLGFSIFIIFVLSIIVPKRLIRFLKGFKLLLPPNKSLKSDAASGAA